MMTTTTNVDSLDYDATHERMIAIHERMEQLAAKPRMSHADDVEFAKLRDEFDTLDRHRLKLERAASIASAAGGGNGNLRVERGSIQPHADENRPHNGFRDGAMRAIDRLVSANQLPARAAESVEALTKTGTGLEQS